jgi:hypothetical protein
MSHGVSDEEELLPIPHTVNADEKMNPQQHTAVEWEVSIQRF